MSVLKIRTSGNIFYKDITADIEEAASQQDYFNGIAAAYVMHTTSALCIIEHEEGVIKDLIKRLEVIAPDDHEYMHNITAGDGNGAAHVKAACLGQSIMVPVRNGKLCLGTYQRPFIFDFDPPRTREVILTFLHS